MQAVASRQVPLGQGVAGPLVQPPVASHMGARVSMPAAHCGSPQIVPVASGDHTVCEVPGTQAWQALAGFGSPDVTQAPPMTHAVSSMA